MLLGREVGRFVLEAAIWLGLEALIAVGVSWAVTRLVGGEISRHVPVAFAGAVVLAALAHRFGAPYAWAPEIGIRPLPVAWSVAGAGITALAVRWRAD